MKKIGLILVVGMVVAVLVGCSGGKTISTRPTVITHDAPVAKEQPGVNRGQARASAEHLETGKRKWRVGDHKNAAKHFAKAVQKNPFNFEAHYWLAVIDRDQARWERSNNHFAQAVQNCPPGRWESRIRVDWGLMFEAQGQKGMAAKQYDLALLADPEFKQAQTARSRVLPPPSASYDR